MPNPDRVQLDGVSKQAADRLAQAFARALLGGPLSVQLTPAPAPQQPEVPVPDAGAYAPLVRDTRVAVEQRGYLDSDARLRWVPVEGPEPPASWLPLFVLALPVSE